MDLKEVMEASAVKRVQKRFDFSRSATEAISNAMIEGVKSAEDNLDIPFAQGIVTYINNNIQQLTDDLFYVPDEFFFRIHSFAIKNPDDCEGFVAYIGQEQKRYLSFTLPEIEHESNFENSFDRAIYLLKYGDRESAVNKAFGCLERHISVMLQIKLDFCGGLISYKLGSVKGGVHVEEA